MDKTPSSCAADKYTKKFKIIVLIAWFPRYGVLTFFFFFFLFFFFFAVFSLYYVLEYKNAQY